MFSWEMTYLTKKKNLNKEIENFEQKIDDCEVSYYVSKRSMSICCESFTMTETIAKKLLKLMFN